MIGIYLIKSPTNKIYVGQSWNIEKRRNYYKNLHCKGQRKLCNSLKKYCLKKTKVRLWMKKLK